jgi:hypothetical protein
MVAVRILSRSAAAWKVYYSYTYPSSVFPLSQVPSLAFMTHIEPVTDARDMKFFILIDAAPIAFAT